MSILVPCPHCGPREFTEFSYGGETRARPLPGAPDDDLTRYLYTRRNVRGVQQEWWYHRAGCRSWFLAQRDTDSNRFVDSFWPRDERRAR